MTMTTEETVTASRPLEGIVVLDFAQFLAGPMATLRLADLGADVIKVERPGTGELGRDLLLSDQLIDGASGLFQTINRGKRSVTANLKDENDLERVRQLIDSADVLVENFRPGVMERLGLGPEDVRARNPRLIYARVTGYGPDGPWRGAPGQDLLVQAKSGLMWLSGRLSDPPTPTGLSLVDIYTGSVITQAILAALVGRATTGQGSCVETSLLEAAADLQVEQLTVFLNDGGHQPQRGSVATAHPNLTAPYGVYATSDGWLALAMSSLTDLAVLLDIEALAEPSAATFVNRDPITQLISDRLVGGTTRAWLDVLEPAGVWCAEVLNWRALSAEPGWAAAEIVQSVQTSGGGSFRTTRCPIRYNGARLVNDRPAPKLGEHGSVAVGVEETAS